MEKGGAHDDVMGVSRDGMGERGRGGLCGADLYGGADALCRCKGLWERSCASKDGSWLIQRHREIH